MKYNNKKLRRVSKLINTTIAIVLCGFLIAFSTLLIDDADQWKDYPMLNDYEDKAFLNEQQTEIDVHRRKIEFLEDKNEITALKLESAKKEHENAKESFNNWLAARNSTGSNQQDEAVLERANALDAFFEIEQILITQRTQVESKIEAQYEQINLIEDIINIESVRANKAWRNAVNRHQLNTFLVRFSIIFPLLLLAIFFAVKLRKHKYWPLFMGYILFALYAFFFGLVPYLPSYGGYIRYSVGILLCLGAGIYSINKIKAFVERKRNELTASQSERANKVQIDIAEKALDNHMCPSCGKDFVIRSWKKLPGKTSKTQSILSTTSFCRFCGLVLFKDCNKCGTENFAHLPFCSSCGTNIEITE